MSDRCRSTSAICAASRVANASNTRSATSTGGTVVDVTASDTAATVDDDVDEADAIEDVAHRATEFAVVRQVVRGDPSATVDGEFVG